MNSYDFLMIGNLLMQKMKIGQFSMVIMSKHLLISHTTSRSD